MRPHETVILEISSERERQMSAEGWTTEHDDGWSGGQLARAAASYSIWSSLSASVRELLGSNDVSLNDAVFYRRYWPWGRMWWKPTDPRRALIKAGALIVAEIERIDRKDKAEASNG
jgi:hypothetical protein